MNQIIRSTAGGSRAVRQQLQQHQQALLLRKAMGLAIVTSGLAVIVAQALQHAFGA